jgi:hypothetical protein
MLSANQCASLGALYAGRLRTRPCRGGSEMLATSLLGEAETYGWRVVAL